MRDSLRLAARATDDTASLHATAAELYRLSEWLEAATPRTIDLFRAAHLRPAPYERFLETIVIEPGAGLCSMIVADASLRLRGSIESLALLGQNVRFVAKQGAGEHLHVEHHPGHVFLAPDSAALVFAVEEPAA
jgi:hypothetical protein